MLEFWDRHPALCEDDEVMAALHFDTSCGNTQMRIKAICRPLGYTLSDASFDTACNEIKGKEVMYLDRHTVACSEGQALGRVRLTSDLSTVGSCSGDDMTLAYGCRITTRPPPSPPPSQPPPHPRTACSALTKSSSQTRHLPF